MLRLWGRVLEPDGQPVSRAVGYVYVRRDHWRVLSDDLTQDPVFGTAWEYTNVQVGITEDGRFDLPDAELAKLPEGDKLFALHVHTRNGKKRFTNSFSRTGSKHDLILRGLSRKVVVAVFGDSDSSDRGPIGSRTTTVAREITSDRIQGVNRAEGATPAHGWLPQEGSDKRNSGIEQVTRACREMDIIDVAVCRFGLNDAHLPDFNPVSPAGIASFRSSYAKIIQTLKGKGAKVILCTIILEGGGRNRAADSAINDVIRDLAKDMNCGLVDAGIDALDDPLSLVWKDGIHLNNAGTRFVASLIEDEIVKMPF